MSDPTPTPTPTPTPVPKTAVTRSDTNQGILDELTNAQKVAAAALDPAHTAGLAAVELDATLPPKINALAQKITGDLAALKTARVAKLTATAQETAARDKLLAVLAPIQTAARRKFKGLDATQRDAYYIGASLGTQSLADVLIACRNVLARLVPGDQGAPPQDTLPGITATGAIQDLDFAISGYADDNTEQGDQQTEASGTLEAIWAEVAVLAGYRRDVQLAADQAWPWRADGVATLRKTFLLPANQPLKD